MRCLLASPATHRVALGSMAVALALLAAPACTDDCSDGPGIDNALASAERWVRARSWPGIGSTDGTTSVDLRVAPVASDGTEGPTALETLAIHDSFAPGIESALAHGERVYLAVASEGLEDETVSYVVSVNTDG